jgi:hypothetical protein
MLPWSLCTITQREVGQLVNHLEIGLGWCMHTVLKWESDEKGTVDKIAISPLRCSLAISPYVPNLPVPLHP